MYTKGEDKIVKRVVCLVRDVIYNFALKENCSIEDAQDFAQEACLKVLNRYKKRGLPGFIGRDNDRFEVLRQVFKIFGALDLENVRYRLSDNQGYFEPPLGELELFRKRFHKSPLDELIESEELSELKLIINAIRPAEVRDTLVAVYSGDAAINDLGVGKTTYDRRLKRGRNILEEKLSPQSLRYVQPVSTRTAV